MKAKVMILNSRSRKHLLKSLTNQFGVKKLPNKVYFCLNKQERVYITERDAFDVEQNALRVNTFGLYFGTITPEGFQLSIEGIQILKDQITKQIIIISTKERDAWLRGEDLNKKSEWINKYVILKHKTDFIGCGKQQQENIINYLPKSRRLKNVFEADSE